MSAIAAAFIKAKRQFAPAVKKAKNSHFGSSYATLDACFDAVNDALLDAGIAVYQEITSDDVGVFIETVLLHETGDTIRSGKLHFPASKRDAQGFSSAATYARRVSLLGVCGIAPRDDDGEAARKVAEQDQRASDDRLNHFADRIQKATSTDELQAIWKGAVEACKEAGDHEAHAVIKKMVQDAGARMKAAA